MKNANDSILLIDKPKGWTSFDVVKKVKYSLKLKKVGHAGTLDPLATGLLLVGTGKCTKELQMLQTQDKTYEGIIEVGKTTPSYDLETEFDSISDFIHLQEEQVVKAAHQLTGKIQQIPPAHSAVKINGVRAYKIARKKEKVDIEPREVTVFEFAVLKISLPEVHFRIQCSKGTYIRSIAHDFGKILGVGGYLKELRRTRIGTYGIEQSQTLEDFLEAYNKENANH